MAIYRCRLDGRSLTQRVWYSCNDSPQAIADGHWGFGNNQEVSILLNIVPSVALILILLIERGGNFLKRWMEFLEENADLRYPDASTLSLEA